MELNIYVNYERQTVQLFEITFEEKEDRFKSLRLSKGTYPDNVDLDYKDQSVDFKSDFLANPKEDYETLQEFYASLMWKTVEDEEVLDSNWFCFKKGTPRKEVAFFMQTLDRSIRS